MPNNAQDYIAAFRRGEAFVRPSTGLVSAGQPDPTALRLLGDELAVADPIARENIVELLVDLGLRTDPLTPRGAEVLRQPRILSLLAGPGLARPDLGREAAAAALRRYALPADLALHGDAMLAALREAPSDELLLLIAKTKPAGARLLLDALVRTPPWHTSLSAKIARAALGARDAEDGFLAAAEAATDGRALAAALGTLSLVGTTRSLQAIAMQLRTPLVIVIPGAMEKSVRLSVLDALRYHFPDQPLLYPNNIANAAGYAAAERFCSDALGVRYDQPVPPFLTFRGLPIPAR